MHLTDACTRCFVAVYGNVMHLCNGIVDAWLELGTHPSRSLSYASHLISSHLIGHPDRHRM